MVQRALGILVEKQDRIVEIVVRESGKPATEARMMEVFAACDAMTYWSKRAPRLLRTERVRAARAAAAAPRSSRSPTGRSAWSA